MKNKSKKHYHFTEKQKRRDRFKNGKQMWSVPAWYRKMFNRELKAKERQATRKINLGKEDVMYPVFKRNIRWYWW